MYQYRNYIITAAFLFVLFLYGVKVFLESQVAIEGHEVYDLQQELKQIRAKNDELKNEILNLTSLRIIKAEAEKMGFKELDPKDYYYVTETAN